MSAWLEIAVAVIGSLTVMWLFYGAWLVVNDREAAYRNRYNRRKKNDK
jgi:hypothetical protein